MMRIGLRQFWLQYVAQYVLLSRNDATICWNYWSKRRGGKIGLVISQDAISNQSFRLNASRLYIYHERLRVPVIRAIA